jgi:hypothetical protein
VVALARRRGAHRLALLSFKPVDPETDAPLFRHICVADHLPRRQPVLQRRSRIRDAAAAGLRGRRRLCGSALLAALSKRFPRFWVGGFVRLDTLSNAKFEDSPLVKDDSFVTAGFAITWVCMESKTMDETGRDRDLAI